MDLQTLSDREEIVDLISTYNKAKALVRHHMLMFQREGPHNQNQIWNTGFYYRTVVRSGDAGGFQKSFRLLTAR